MVGAVLVRPHLQRLSPLQADHDRRDEFDQTWRHKASWISGLATWVGRYRAVKAVVWFDTKQSNDWRVDSSARTFRAYRALARSRLFLG